MHHLNLLMRIEPCWQKILYVRVLKPDLSFSDVRVSNSQEGTKSKGQKKPKQNKKPEEPQ